MTCNGCANAITRILSKNSNIKEIKPNVEAKELIVIGNVTSDEVMELLSPWSTA